MVDLNPPFVGVLMSYQRALASKSAVLKQPGCTSDNLRPWNEVLAKACEKIVDSRCKFLEILNEKAREFHRSFATSDGELAVELESDFLHEGRAMSIEEIFARFEGAAPREIAMRTPTIGAQRDDIAIALGGADAKAYASQGQTRSVVLSLKLGVIEMVEGKTGESPVIVLDDVDSELDRHRSGALFRSLTSKTRQIVVTATEAPPADVIRDHLAHLPYPQILTVSAGSVTSS
jgi:DNA replication and repair protein RecF